MPRGHEYDRQSSRGFESQTRWNAPHVTRTCDRVRGKAKDGETKDMISRSNVRDIGTNRPNDAANFVAENSRIRSVARIKRERLEHVAEIHSRRFHFDQHLTRSTLRQLEWRKAKRIEMTAFTRFQTQRKCRIEPLLA